MAKQSDRPDLDPEDALPDDPREPMTDVQAAQLRDLTEKTGTEYDESLTSGEAEERIADLARRAG